MDRRDRELLERQTRHIAAAQSGAGVLALAGAAMFVAGLVFGAVSERAASTAVATPAPAVFASLGRAHAQ